MGTLIYTELRTGTKFMEILFYFSNIQHVWEINTNKYDKYIQMRTCKLICAWKWICLKVSWETISPSKWCIIKYLARVNANHKTTLEMNDSRALMLMRRFEKRTIWFRTEGICLAPWKKSLFSEPKYFSSLGWTFPNFPLEKCKWSKIFANRHLGYKEKK